MAPQPVANNYTQPALPTFKRGWPFNSIDYQITTKQNGWNQGQNERLAEFYEGVRLGAIYGGLATPYNNPTKFTNYVKDCRMAGLIPNFRSHWDGWQGDNGWDSVSGSVTSITHSTTTATVTTSGAHGLVTGQGVLISGAVQSQYNGQFAVTVVDSTHFTYVMASDPGANATGTINWQLQLFLTRSGTTVTGKSVVAHGLYVGATIIIAGATQAPYNGRFTIVSVPDTLTFTYTAGSTPGASPATGFPVLRYDRQTYLDKTYDFIVANPTLFKAGDLFAMCVECNQADNSSNPTFHTDGTTGTSFDYSLYNQFCKDQVRYANAAFLAAGISGVHTWPISLSLSNLNLNGQALYNGDTGNGSGLTDADIVQYFAGRLSVDHYNDTSITDGQTYYKAHLSDVQKMKQAFPSCLIYLAEWGYHTQTQQSEGNQYAVYDAVVKANKSLSYVIGMNFWNNLGQSQSSIWVDNSGTMIPGGHYCTRAIIKAFKGTNAYNAGRILI